MAAEYNISEEQKASFVAVKNFFHEMETKDYEVKTKDLIYEIEKDLCKAQRDPLRAAGLLSGRGF